MLRHRVFVLMLLSGVVRADVPTPERIEPVRPIEQILAEATAASPPLEDGAFRASDLVELVSIEPGIRLDIRYAGPDNFLGVAVYAQARAFLQRPAALALQRAHRSLAEQGLGLMVFDGYRPWYVTKAFWDATPVAQHDYVADPALGSRHNRGCAVDLTLYSLATGAALPMPSEYDDFSERAHPDFAGSSAERRANRDLLRRVMEAQGFTVYPSEWWHFDYVDYRHYRIGNQRFEDLGQAP